MRRITARLQPRDYVLAHLLDDHRVLTAPQIHTTLFTSPRTCRNRLDALRHLGFIDKFLPTRHGDRLPAHWVPGLLSARYAALARGDRPPTAKAVRDRQDAIAASPHLHHTTGTNQFFIDLIAYSRTHAGFRLTRWWPDHRIAAALGRRVHPDGHGVWRHHDTEVGFLLEYDTGTETLGTLVGKLAAYRRLRADDGPDWPILIYLPTTTRETNLHHKLAATTLTGITVATAARDRVNGAGPAGPVWRLAGNGRHRLHLAELPARAGRPGPYHPGPPTPDQDPLYLL
ncbi:replication-relaxation family protein [Polymorphospora rubra]|uniref:replication-relaxation family protein n=1 Tax=Polymorphospora rubra TaxID=338584 RepID=UPI003411D720